MLKSAARFVSGLAILAYFISPISVRVDSTRAATAAVDTFILAEYTFDMAGAPDTQGWITVDATAQDTFFHVDNFAGLYEYAPLEGSQSMWCGIRADDPRACNYVTAPGYGDDWNQYFESVTFAVEGDVKISYKIKWDMEPAILDVLRLAYTDTSDTWVDLPVNGGKGWYDSDGALTETLIIDGPSLGDGVRFRFTFYSDGAWSDEDGNWPTDGAAVIDSLMVSDATGVIDFQDFEVESVGALSTADGDWQAATREPYGDFAGLFPGMEVLQEDSLQTNDSGLWGFFGRSTVDFTCGGHPEQAAVPYSRLTADGYGGLYINNEIWSPVIDYTRDLNGTPIPGDSAAAVLEFDVYKDLPLDNLVFYSWYVRGFSNGCPGEWQNRNQVFYSENGEKAWFRDVQPFDDLIEPGVTEIQVKLVCVDMCGFWCGLYGSGDCHSHAPLFDNVKVYRTVTADPTSVPDTPTLETALMQNYPNPFNPTTTIRYLLSRWDHVNLSIYNVAGQRVRTLVDEVQAPRPEGFVVTWDGMVDGGAPASTGIYFYRLQVGTYTATKKMILLK